MDVFTAMKERQSIRKYLEEAVPREHILRMAEAASWAPTPGNAQNFRFLVVQDKETLAQMRGMVDELLARTTGKETPPGKPSNHNFFAFAPVAVCVVATHCESPTDKAMRERDPERYKLRRLHVNPSLQGISAAITQFLLAAHALGYGTCWMTGPLVAKPELECMLQLHQPEQLVAVIALGRKEYAPMKPPRKSAEEITIFL